LGDSLILSFFRDDYLLTSTDVLRSQVLSDNIRVYSEVGKCPPSLLKATIFP
jgi:hypothetical protein